MKRDVTQQATEYSRSHRRKKRWQQVMTGLAAVVVFCTTYALILPAITLEEPVCGLEEHAHTEACYTQVTSVEEKELVCTEPVHVHDDTCYETVQTLICPLEEDENHQHDESCYETTVQLICEQPEHEHTDACYETVTVPADTKTLTCTIPEDENHTHTALCYGTWELTCGQEAHEHTEACYAAETDYSAESDPEADLETQTDWEATLEDVSLTGEYRQDVLAVAESQLGYQESLRNYMTDDNGICRGYSRYGAWYGDPYGDWSAMYAAFCLSYAQVEGMPLNSDCAAWAEALSAEDCGLYCLAEDHEPVPGDLIFFSTDGTGTPDRVGLVTARIAAVGDTPEQLRVIGGDSENRVRYETYTLSDETIAGYAALPEQTFVCGREGHVHTAFCYDSHGNVTCGKEEHIHTDICEAADAEQAELLFTGPDYTITVRYGTDAAFPEGVTLTAEEILPDSDAYQTYLDQTLQLLEAETAEQVLFARFFDIRFLTDSGEVEPAAPVEVTITYAETVDTPEPATCQAVHFAGDGAELLDAQTQTPEEGTTSFTHVQETFSVTGDVVSVAADYNETDVGPDSLPVDYYVCIDGTWTCVGSTKTGWYSNRQNGEESLINYNRDYITVAQAVSILGPYGFTGNEENPSRVTAYQQKSGHTKIYSDTDTVTVPQGEDSGTKILPLSVNGDHAGYNIYYLPNNSKNISAITSPDSLDKSANGFYTVTVYDAQGALLTSQIVKTGGSFTYTASESPANGWLVAYVSGSTSTVTGSTITLSNITSTVTVSPSRGTTTSHSVTFKVMIDGQWQTVGSLPYYYTGTVNGSQRAYITSDMAAQFFGDFGYTATAAPEYHFGYSYNDIYEIVYCNADTKAPTNYCMDVDGANYQQGTKIQVYTRNGSDAQQFRIRTAEQNGGDEGYMYLTPFRNSGLQVNLSGAGEANNQKLVLWGSPTIHSSWKVVPEDGELVSFQLKENAEYSIDVSSNKPGDGVQLQIYYNAGAKYWQLNQKFRISNDTVSAQNADGTYNIGLTTESNGDIVCYYMPAETGSKYTKAAGSEIDTANSCWSITVRDDTHSVYSDGELSGMVRYVAPGGEATVTVRNADGVLWGCRGVNGETIAVERTATAGETIFTITSITQPIEVVAGRIDPSYTVQFYAWMDVAADSGTTALQVIDTSGRKLPGNYTSWVKSAEQTAPSPAALKQIYLNTDGTLATISKLLEVYSAQDYEYVKAPDLAYVNKLEENTNYTLKAIWVLRPGCDPSSTDESDWTVYGTDASFVNSTPKNANEIMVTDDTVIRLVYDESSGPYTNGANFFDYDITDGSRVEKYDTSHSMNYVVAQTGQFGINSSANYYGSGTKLAFGNRNTGMLLQDQLWETNYLNHLNASLPAKDPGYGLNMNEMRGFQGCTFGLVTGLKSDGTIQYASGVDAPKLFNESGTVTGKTPFDNGEFSLQFNRVGDTYTLSAVNTSDGKIAAGTLEKFNNALGSNNFWPMDSASTWGAEGHDLKFGDSSKKHERRYNKGGYWDSLPVSDDGQDHNSYFGMQYAVNFNLTEDYVGPLEYYFYGDDDMWVFLDNQLVCDIGGVHSTVGEYVNLWDYIEKGDAGTHTLTFFYTERGASGSTCYMRFTLPSVSNATLSKQHGDLEISKAVTAEGFEDFSYQFQVDLLTKQGGPAINQTCRYIVKDGSGTASYGIVRSGEKISLKAGQTATINGIPAGTYYQVTEVESSRSGYQTTVNGDTGYIIAGEIANGKIQSAAFVNTPYYELPSTGGTGTERYTIGGLALVIGAGALLLFSHKKRGKGDHASS